MWGVIKRNGKSVVSCSSNNNRSIIAVVVDVGEHCQPFDAASGTFEYVVDQLQHKRAAVLPILITSMAWNMQSLKKEWRNSTTTGASMLVRMMVRMATKPATQTKIPWHQFGLPLQQWGVVDFSNMIRFAVHLPGQSCKGCDPMCLQRVEER
jgi:hypothetical protein